MAPIIASDSGSKDFDPAPAGAHFAVCCDVVDLGMVTTSYEGKESKRRMVRLAFQLNEASGLRDDGKRWLVTKSMTLSLHEKAALRAFGEAWRGKSFTEEELKGFDVENMLGACCQLLLLHEKGKNDRIYANIKTVMPFPKGMTKFAPVGYVRVQDRPKDGVDDPTAHDDGAPPPTDDDAPF